MPGPLDGYKVVDLTQVVSGPLATMLMADQGAEVIKVEPLTGAGDVSRVPAYTKGGIGSFFINNNRGKRGLGVDLASDAGRQIVLDLAAESDVFVENFRPGACARLGLGFEDVARVNPEIIYCSVSGFGPTGPYSDRPVLDPIIQGLAGVVSRQLNPEIPIPDLIRNLYADKATALTVAQAVTAALLVREKGGGGQLIDVPMIDACLYFFWPDGMMDKTLIDDDVSPGFLLSTVYSLTETADGRIVYFVVSDAQRHGLYEALGHPEWKSDPRFCDMAAISNRENFEALGALLGEAFRQVTSEEVLARLLECDVPAGQILDAEEVIVDPQVVHNGTLVEWQHPDAGTVRQPVPAARFSVTPARVATSAAHRGQHNDAILTELGRSESDIAALREAGVVN